MESLSGEPAFYLEPSWASAIFSLFTGLQIILPPAHELAIQGRKQHQRSRVAPRGLQAFICLTNGDPGAPTFFGVFLRRSRQRAQTRGHPRPDARAHTSAIC